MATTTNILPLPTDPDGYPIIDVDVTETASGVVSLTFECPWGCGTRRKPKKHGTAVAGSVQRPSLRWNVIPIFSVL